MRTRWYHRGFGIVFGAAFLAVLAWAAVEQVGRWMGIW